MSSGDSGWNGAGRAWRLLLSGAGDGAANMGIDEAILEARIAGAAPPTLRLYWWSRPTLSLGRFQPMTDVDLDACEWESVDVVRRPTGGRAVLHDEELTYSVVASSADGLPTGVAASYRVLCGALVSAYERLGMRAELTHGRRGESSSACYLQATRADLSLGAAKLSGSAQVWRSSACLQHGSFVLARNASLEARLLRLGEAGAERLERSTATISDVLGRAVSREAVAEAVVAAFADVLNVELHIGDATADELSRAAVLGRKARVLEGSERRRG